MYAPLLREIHRCLYQHGGPAVPPFPACPQTIRLRRFPHILPVPDIA